MKLWSVLLVVVLLAVCAVAATAGTCYSDPISAIPRDPPEEYYDADVSPPSPLEWEAWSTEFTYHYQCVADGVRQPDAPPPSSKCSYISTRDTGLTETFTLDHDVIPAGATVDSIVLWAYSWDKNYAGDKIYGSISVNGWSPPNFVNFYFPYPIGAGAWKSLTFTGPWTGVSSLYCQLKTAGAYSGGDHIRRVAAVYAEINYH
jgi:hypothetical protein